MKSPDERYRKLQRQVEMQLRKIQAKFDFSKAPFYQTVKHQPEEPHKLWKSQVVLVTKLFAITVMVLIAVQIASVLAKFFIVALLVGVAYKLFFDYRK